MIPPKRPETYARLVEAIVAENWRLWNAWRAVCSWGPGSAGAILEKSRLDRQVSLSECLGLWDKPKLTDGELVLAWANLGSLVEGTLKLLLVVFVEDYRKDPSARRDRRGDVREPQGLSLEPLRSFLVAAGVFDGWEPFVGMVQQRRNTIHAFEDRDLGGTAEFKNAVRQYFEMLQEVANTLPDLPDPQDE